MAVKTVIGVFENKQQAEKAVNALRNSGFDTNEISIVAKGGKKNNGNNGDEETLEMDTLTDGTATGGVIGGLAGLAIGAGALAIPGIGPLFAAGPIAGLLSGAATGGIAGSLIDWGIPAERGRYYEEEVKKGKMLTVIRAHEQKVQQAADLLRQNGAKDVETH
ncbi:MULTISPECIES: general stress protein [Thermovenabulum]|mgnify:CR=1 FL=1|uniref:General stress protein 17M-like domain-containing protein n=2 Tax=Thermovenabulum TaxID=159730 RepID=A0A162N104_9FIRM|nr:general stress protein [Thermovenabulum gondwanense]KYO68653.1 hypothetical protein ATZ99_01620 [Thermovenabulum gondwanense]